MIKRFIRSKFTILSDYKQIRRIYKQKFGYNPNVIFAKTFNEKIQHRKIFERNKMMPMLADKIEVKHFVANLLGESWVIPTIWNGSVLPPVSERVWQIPFVMKASHGSGMNLFLRKHDDIDWEKIENICNKWVNIKFGDWLGEWLYSQIKPRILVEPFVGDDFLSPIDFKFWVFHGKVVYIQVDLDREGDHKRVMFDRSWKYAPFNYGFKNENVSIDRPKAFFSMIEAAEKLSYGFDFVRVDFYEINSMPKFGEITFYPASGMKPFFPEEYDRIVGALW